MNATLSLPPLDDIDTTMLKVARNIAMGIYPLEQILENLDVQPKDFARWNRHPRFLAYLKSESEEWNSALNTAERTKVKAGIVMENFMVEAHTALHDAKTPLNQRVELGKLLAKLAGMGETRVGGPGGGGSGFQLNINIGAGTPPITIRGNFPQVVEHQEPEDDYNPFVSPDTLGDE